MGILLAQGVGTTLFSLLFLFMPSVSTSYWILSVLTAQIIIIMYALRRRRAAAAVHAPGGPRRTASRAAPPASGSPRPSGSSGACVVRPRDRAARPAPAGNPVLYVGASRSG